MPLDKTVEHILVKRGYRLAGSHSAVKICHWLRQSMLHGRACYKQEFYGIQSHRCLQMTPTVDHCNQHCLFCWRHHNSSGIKSEDVDEPEQILDRCIEGQRKLITGFKGDPRCTKKMWEEANEPKQVAISLAGEPTLYPRLGEFIALCHKRGMTTFLVTNGTMPKVLEKLDPLPTQLYLTVAAPDEETYKKLCIPTFPKGWELLNKTLELLPSLKGRTRTTIRHTLVQGWNFGLDLVDKYAKLDEKADPHFIEPKGFVLVGESRQHFHLDNMPAHADIVAFGQKLGDKLGYEIAGQRADSRVVVLAKDKKMLRIPRL
jgi:tRNA wybutosine-synthesizing protein 1